MRCSKFSSKLLRKKAYLSGRRIECASEGQQKGFTLIELSIVLVIIGLLVAGVLTGQDLVAAAKIRATVAQYESYNTSSNAFVSKYGGLPGDIAASTAESFGFAFVNGGGPTQGDGDGLIGSTVSLATAESLLFWSDIYNANLIPNALSFIPAGAAWTPADDTGIASIAVSLPVAKIAGGNYWWVGTFTDGFNYYGLGPVTSVPVSSGTAGPVMAGGGLSPVQAYDIDVKVDDGLANTGVVQSINSSVGGTATLAYGGSGGSCINSTNASNYSGGTLAQSRTPACQIRMRFN